LNHLGFSCSTITGSGISAPSIFVHSSSVHLSLCLSP
jgi:hypothetical protein